MSQQQRKPLQPVNNNVVASRTSWSATERPPRHPALVPLLEKENSRSHSTRLVRGTRKRQSPTTTHQIQAVPTTEEESECSSILGVNDNNRRPGPSTAAMPPTSPNSDSSESTSNSSTELWTAELAGMSNVDCIFCFNGRRYRHPTLPPGWNLGISRTCNKLFYHHPDFGCSFFPPIVLPSMANVERVVTRRRGANRNHPSSPQDSVATVETCSVTASMTSNFSDEQQNDSLSHSPMALENLDDAATESTRHAGETYSNESRDTEERLSYAAGTAQTMVAPSCIYQANDASSAAVDSNDVAQASKVSVEVHKRMMGCATIVDKAANKHHQTKHFELSDLPPLPLSEQTPESGTRNNSPLQGVSGFGTANADLDEDRDGCYPNLNKRRSPSVRSESLSRGAEFLAHEQHDSEFPAVDDDFDEDLSGDTLDPNEGQQFSRRPGRIRRSLVRDESPLLRNENKRRAFEMDGDHVSEGPQGVSPQFRCPNQRSATTTNTAGAGISVQALEETTLSPFCSGDDDEFEENDLKFPAACVDTSQAITRVRQSPQSSVSTEDSCPSSDDVGRLPFRRRRRSIDNPKEDTTISRSSQDETLPTVNIHLPASRTTPHGNAGRSNSFSRRVRVPPHPLCSLQNIESLPLPVTEKAPTKSCTRIASDSKSKGLSTGIIKTTRLLPRKGYSTNRPVVNTYTQKKEQPTKRRRQKSIIPRSLRRI